MSALVVAPPAGRPSSLRMLVGLEARRGLRLPWLWLALLLCAYMMYDLSQLGWMGGPYQLLGTAFTPIGLAIFLIGLDSGSRDHRGELPALAEEAVLGGSDRSTARLLALWPIFVLGCVAVAAFGIVERALGGSTLGEEPGRVIAAVHSPAELLQPVLLFALAGSVGVAAGRLRYARVPVAIAGVVSAFAFGMTAWAFQWSPARYLVPMQTQPVFVTIGSRGNGSVSMPLGWVLDAPDEFHQDWQRIVVSQSMAAWHDVYLMGLTVVFVGLAVRRRWSRLAIAIGVFAVVVGVVAQILVTPDAIHLVSGGP